MNITSRILLNGNFQSIAFCGGKGRLRLMRRIIAEVVRNRQRVLVVATIPQRLPARGTVVVGAYLPLLLESIAAEYQRHPAVYAARAVEEGGLRGFGLAEIETLRNALPADFLLIDLGERSRAPDLALRQWQQHHPWDQMVYCLDITQFDRAGTQSEESAGTGRYPGLPEPARARPSFEQLVFGQPWPALLFFHQVNMLARESRAIQLSRELRSLGVQHVAFANLQENTVKRLQLQ